MKFLKKSKNGEVIIYAIALMLVAAGYLNYTTSNTEETYVEDVAEVSNNDTSIGDATLVSSNEIVENNEVVQDMTQENSNDSTTKEEDYFAKTKLDRDTMYASTISTYQAILEKNDVSEAQKSIATQEITKINNIKNAIMISENLILNKGFENCVILVNEESVNAVVKSSDGLDTKKVSQIQNIISREMKVEIENIHITERK